MMFLLINLSEIFNEKNLPASGEETVDMFKEREYDYFPKIASLNSVSPKENFSKDTNKQPNQMFDQKGTRLWLIIYPETRFYQQILL